MHEEFLHSKIQLLSQKSHLGVAGLGMCHLKRHPVFVLFFCSFPGTYSWPLSETGDGDNATCYLIQHV